MNKDEIQKAISDYVHYPVLLRSTVKNLPELDKKMESIFQMPFFSFEKNYTKTRTFYLFFELDGGLFQIYCTIFAEGETQSRVDSVMLNEGKIFHRAINTCSKNNKILDIAYTFLEEIKNLNQLRLLEATGLLTIDFENIIFGCKMR